MLLFIMMTINIINITILLLPQLHINTTIITATIM
jgi:hypothetical protein